ncbi:MAG: hypothetical protein U1U88_000187 [Lawsonella clevelandensis]
MAVDSEHVDQGEIQIEKMELDEMASPSRLVNTRRCRATLSSWHWARMLDLSLIENDDEIEISNGVVQVSDEIMTGHRGIFAGGDMVPLSYRYRCDRPRKKAARYRRLPSRH